MDWVLLTIVWATLQVVWRKIIMRKIKELRQVKAIKRMIKQTFKADDPRREQFLQKLEHRRCIYHDKLNIELFFREIALASAIRLNFDKVEPPVPEDLRKRHLLTDIFAKITIHKQTDTIDAFYEKAKRRNDGSSVPLGGNFDYFVCPYTGDTFPVSEAINLYHGLWISYLNNNPDLVAFMKEYGVENLGNSYRCKKTLSLYAADKESFMQSVRSSKWYQNMAQKQQKPSLNAKIQLAASKASHAMPDSPKGHNRCDGELR